MTESVIKALQYIKNTNGGATVANFLEDHEPIGRQLFRDLNYPEVLIEIKDGKMYLTDEGKEALELNAR